MRFLFHVSLVAVASLAFAAYATAQCPPSNKGGDRPTIPANPAPGSPGKPSPTGPSAPGPTTPGPTTPGPTTPTGPTPTGPKTPRPSGPTTPGGPRGAPIVFTRQSTSKEILEFDWHFPVLGKFKDNVQVGKTYARRDAVSLPEIEAFAMVAGKDNRPLLVLRECDLCKGSDAALLRRSIGDEKTKLLANWFHCIKLPPDVLRVGHPFKNLFPAEKPPHLFFSKADGSERVTLTGNMKQGDLHKAMVQTLKANYRNSPKPALRVMVMLLSEFDSLDIMEQTQKRQLRTALYKNKPTSSKVKKLKLKLAKTQRKKASAMRRAKAVCDLKLIVEKGK